MRYRFVTAVLDAGEINKKIISALGIEPTGVTVASEGIEVQFPEPLPAEMKNKLKSLLKAYIPHLQLLEE